MQCYKTLYTCSARKSAFISVQQNIRARQKITAIRHGITNFSHFYALCLLPLLKREFNNLAVEIFMHRSYFAIKTGVISTCSAYVPRKFEIREQRNLQRFMFFRF